MGNATSAAKARRLEHQTKALELRRAGKGYVEIAATLGISKTHAHRLVTAGMADSIAQIDASVRELRAEEISRLDAMLGSLWPQARRGAVQSVDRVLKIMERRARLLGVDAPVKVAIGGDRSAPPIQSVSMTLDEFKALAAEVAGKV